MPSGSEHTAWPERRNRLASRTALVSGGLEPVLDSGGGNHSVFAKAFQNALRGNDDVLDGQAVYRTVSRPVVLNAPDQTPRYSDIRAAAHEGGDADRACSHGNVYDLSGKTELGLNWRHHDCCDRRVMAALVGSFRRNAFGLHDTLGNVFEWVEDCWSDSY